MSSTSPDKHRHHPDELLKERAAGLKAINEQLQAEIAERKQAEEELQASAQQWEATFNAVSDAVSLIDLEGRIIQCNQAMSNLLGKPSSEIIGSTCWELMHGTSEPIEGCPVVRMRETRRRETLVLPIADRWLEISVDPLLDGSGALMGAVHIITDITGRKEAEEALRESGERFRALIDNAQDCISIIAEDGTIQYASPSVERTLGYKLEDTVGTHGFDFVHPDDMQNAADLFDRVIKNLPSAVSTEIRVRHKDGSWRLFETIGQNLLDDPAVEGIVINYRDITERKRAEEVLRESEEQYRLLFQSSSAAITHFDTEGKYVLLNRQGIKNLGEKAKDIIGKSIYDVYPEVADFHMQRFAKIMKEGKGAVFEDSFELTKGKTWFSSNIQPVKDRNDRVVGVQIVSDDITERKQAEEALRESEERFRALIDNAADIIVIIDCDGVIQYESPAAERVLGFRLDEVVGQDGFSFVHPDDLAEATHLFTQVMQNPDATVRTEMRSRHKDGTWHAIEIVGRNLFDNPAVRGIVANFRDITERKQAEEALRESEAKLDRYMESALDGIYTIDVEGRFLYVNKATQRITGYSRKEMIGKSFVELGVVPPEYLSKGIRVLKRIVSGKPSTAAEFEFVKKDGSRIFVEISSIPIGEGDSTEIVAVVRDITERKRAEEEIKASLKEKELLLKEIHHRVKNNLQVVSSLLYLQSEHIKDEQSLAIIKESQNRVKSMALVHEQLYQPEGLARVDFAEYIRNLATYLLRSYGVNPDAITLKINADDVSLGIDTAIPCGLITNELVSNSLKHAFPAGKARGDRESEIRIDLHADDNKLTLIVSDNGVGLPGDLDFRNTESLGLYLVNTLTRQLEGSIELDRSGGTAFEITFAEPQH